MGFAERKQMLRIWIERRVADPESPSLLKVVLRAVFDARYLFSWFRHFPRYLRIGIRLRFARGSWVQRILLSIPRAFVGSYDMLFADRGLTVRDGVAKASIANGEVRGRGVTVSETSVNSRERDAIAERLADLNRSQMACRFERANLPELESLRRDGIVRLPELEFDTVKVNETKKFLESRPVYGAHIHVFSDGVGRDPHSVEARLSPFGSYKLSDAVAAPHLIELAFHPKVLALAENYLGCPPTLFSVHSWWSFPGHGKSGPQTFHRDYDDYRFLALFVFLTDIKGGEDGGEHEFVASTQNLESMTRLLSGSQESAAEFFYPQSLGTVHDEASLYRKLFGSQVRSIAGRAGSVFLADTFALHRGVPVKKGDRLVCWIRFGLRKNGVYDHNKSALVPFDWKSGRIEDDEYNRYVGRLILGDD